MQICSFTKIGGVGESVLVQEVITHV